jgi:hypothetical protein
MCCSSDEWRFTVLHLNGRVLELIANILSTVVLDSMINLVAEIRSFFSLSSDITTKPALTGMLEMSRQCGIFFPFYSPHNHLNSIKQN